MHYLYCTSSLSYFCNKHNNTKEINQVGQANSLNFIPMNLLEMCLKLCISIIFCLHSFVNKSPLTEKRRSCEFCSFFSFELRCPYMLWIWDTFYQEWKFSKMCNTNNALILWIKDFRDCCLKFESENVQYK